MGGGGGGGGETEDGTIYIHVLTILYCIILHHVVLSYSIS